MQAALSHRADNAQAARIGDPGADRLAGLGLGPEYHWVTHVSRRELRNGVLDGPLIFEGRETRAWSWRACACSANAERKGPAAHQRPLVLDDRWLPAADAPGRF